MGRRCDGQRPHEPPLPEPLAFFLTWSTYGTWLPGDERGWVEFRHGWKLPDPLRKLEAEARMIEGASILDAQQQALVEQIIVDHCNRRGWELHEVNCRSNHLHVVVGAGQHPTVVRTQFKAWCTRGLRALERKRLAQRASCGTDASKFAVRRNWWAERGSQRYINNESGLEAAIRYVRDGQDGSRFNRQRRDAPH